VWAVWAIVAFVVAVGLHASLCWIPVFSNRVVKYVLVGGVCGVALVVGVVRVEPFLKALAAILLYAFASELYIFLFTLIASSVSTSIIRGLRAGALSARDVELLDSSERMVQIRLERLQAVGLISRDLRGIRLTARGRRVITIFDALRRFFGHSVSRT
jgi:DNA-binding HxlR family transcriptional regulator